MSATASIDLTDAAQVSASATLREVFNAAQNGDPGAFSEIYRRCEPRVRRQLNGRVPSSQVDDLVNETFLRAWRSLQQFRWQGTDPVAWVLVIARNLAADYWSLARNRRELAAEDPADLRSARPQQRGADDIVIDLVEAERLRDALRTASAGPASVPGAAFPRRAFGPRDRRGHGPPGRRRPLTSAAGAQVARRCCRPVLRGPDRPAPPPARRQLGDAGETRSRSIRRPSSARTVSRTPSISTASPTLGRCPSD